MKKIIDKRKKKEREKTGGLRLSSTDKLILMILYKVWWAFDYHIALLIDEPVAYVKGRVKRMAKAGLVGRKYIMVGSHACTYITYKGEKSIDKTMRHVRIPTAAMYEHDLGEVDMYTVLSLLHKGKRLTHFGSIITERDLITIFHKIVVGKGKSNKPVYKYNDKTHIPDGYCITPNGFIALEYERTLKSKSSTTRTEDNYKSNSRRFVKQLWFCETAAVEKKIETIQNGSVVGIVPMDYVRDTLDDLLDRHHKILSKKEGRSRIDNIGNFVTPVALKDMPILDSKKISLER